MIERLQSFIDGTWRPPRTTQALNALNPASAQVLAGWCPCPAGDRVHPLFRLTTLLEGNLDELARSITDECGKTQAQHGVEFYSKTKVVVERWSHDWSRKF